MTKIAEPMFWGPPPLTELPANPTIPQRMAWLRENQRTLRLSDDEIREARWAMHAEDAAATFTNNLHGSM